MAQALFTAVSAGPIKEGILEQVTDAILSGKIKPGERLNESELSRQFKISRAPIREALQQLQEQGLIQNHPRRGMFVVKLDPSDMEKIYPLRILLEAEALRLCKATLTSQADRKILRALERMEATEDLRPGQLARIDLSFHRTIWSFSGNEYLERMLVGLTAPVFAHAVLSVWKEERMRYVMDSHRPLYEFITGATDKTAETVVREHVQSSWELFHTLVKVSSVT